MYKRQVVRFYSILFLFFIFTSTNVLFSVIDAIQMRYDDDDDDDDGCPFPSLPSPSG